MLGRFGLYGGWHERTKKEGSKMIERMSRDERDELRRLAEKATEGAWVVDKMGRYEDHDECKIELPDDDIELCRYENADFIAASRTAVPRLLDDLEVAYDEIDRLSGALKLAQTRAKDLEAEKSRLCEMIIDERAAHKELDEAIAGENARLRAELEAAKRKDMPTPPTRKWGCTYVCPPDCGGADGDEYGWLPLCPTCGYTSELWEHDKRCPDCGQLIDWTSDWRGLAPANCGEQGAPFDEQMGGGEDA